MQQDASDALSHLDRAFAAALEHQRFLMESTAGFLRGESFRFLNLRLDRARDAMEQLSECRDMPAFLTVQKTWIGDLVQDCAAQGQRYSEFWQQGAERVRAEMERHAGEAQAAARAVMDEAAATAHAAADAAHEAVHGAAGQAARNFSEAQEAMAPVNTHNDQYH